jgi:hypothetical protein
MVHAALSTTVGRTASEVCYALPLMRDMVETALNDLLVYGGARVAQSESGTALWFKVET